MNQATRRCTFPRVSVKIRAEVAIDRKDRCRQATRPSCQHRLPENQALRQSLAGWAIRRQLTGLSSRLSTEIGDRPPGERLGQTTTHFTPSSPIVDETLRWRAK